MRKFILLIFIWIPIIALAQEKVVKSENVVLLLGKKYYVHTVKKGETLFAIAKAYDIPAKDIMLINQEEVVSLQNNDILKIPFERDTELTDTKITFVAHKVQKNQSMYSIAKEYSLKEDDIFYYNDFAKKGIKKGDILQIPLKNTIKLLAEDEYFYYHQVKEDENLANISKQYNISEDKIKKVNPEITKEISNGQIIYIPKQEPTEEFLAFLYGKTEVIPDVLNVDPMYFIADDCAPCKEFIYTKEKVFKIAYLLPLYIDYNISNSYDLVEEPKKANFYNITERFIEFYEGSLMAINILREQGISAEIFVYDTKRDSATIEAILAKSEMQEMDLIIGPLYTENLQQVAHFATEHKINLVSPISQKNESLTENPFIYQVSPSKKMIIKHAAEYFDSFIDSNLVIVYNGATEEEIATYYRDNIQSNLAYKYASTDVEIKFINYQTDGYAGLVKALSKTKNNTIIIPSEEEVFISKVLNTLMSYTIDYKATTTVYGLPSWEYMTNVKVEHIRKLNIHFPANYTVNYSDWMTKKFVLSYRETFFAEPSAYSFQGYDITYYFVSALKRYGKYFQFCLSETDAEPNKKGLFLEFAFKRIDAYSGFENNGVFMINYDTELNIIKQDIYLKK